MIPSTISTAPSSPGSQLISSARSSSAIRRNSYRYLRPLAVAVPGDREWSQVPVGVQLLARLAQLGEPAPAPQRPVERRAPGRQQLVLERLIRRVKREAAGEPGHHLEQRVDPSFDGPLA